MQSMKEEIASSMAQDKHPLCAPGRRVGHARFDKGDGQAAGAGEGHVESQIPGAFRGVGARDGVAAMALRESDSRAVTPSARGVLGDDIRHAQAALQELQKDPNTTAPKI